MLEVYSKTDIGRSRSINEDNLLVKKLDEVYLLVVADGLGGHAAGEVASRIALIEIEEFLRAGLGRGDLTEVVKGAILKANSKIYLLSKENPAYANMGTTLVMAVVFQNKALIANVGDSRAYLAGEEIKRITKDHSLVQELLDKKLIVEEEAFQHPRKNVISRALGSESEVKVDFYDIELSGGYLLLCSDGLTDSLRDEEIKEIVNNSRDLSEACTELIDSAKEKGGGDNITVILAKRRNGHTKRLPENNILNFNCNCFLYHSLVQ